MTVAYAEPVTENIPNLIHQAIFFPQFISKSSLLSCHINFLTYQWCSWGILSCIDYKRMQMAYTGMNLGQDGHDLQRSPLSLWGSRLGIQNSPLLELNYTNSVAWRSVQRLTFLKGKRPVRVQQATGKWAAPRRFLTSPTRRGGGDGEGIRVCAQTVSRLKIHWERRVAKWKFYQYSCCSCSSLMRDYARFCVHNKLL